MQNCDAILVLISRTLFELSRTFAIVFLNFLKDLRTIGHHSLSENLQYFVTFVLFDVALLHEDGANLVCVCVCVRARARARACV